MSREALFETAIGTPLYVDRADKRRLLMAKTGGKGQEHVRRIWNHIAANGLTDLFLDIGANYGEIALGTAYPQTADIELFEPNPRISGYLRRSMDAHPDRERLRLHETVLWKASGPVAFGVRLDSSGKSSVHIDQAECEERFLETHELSAYALDDIADQRYARHRSAVLKLDVEGAELECLEGAKRLLSRLDDYLAIVEVNPRQLAKSPVDAETYFDTLGRYGRIYELQGSTLVPFSYEDYARAPRNRDVAVIQGGHWNGLLPLADFDGTPAMPAR